MANIQYQTGVATVGPNPQTTLNPPPNYLPNLKTVTVQFNPAFPPASTVIVTANAIAQPGSNYPDTFAVTIQTVSNAGFTANVYRVDNILTASQGQGWKQTLQLGWMAQII